MHMSVNKNCLSFINTYEYFGSYSSCKKSVPSGTVRKDKQPMFIIPNRPGTGEVLTVKKISLALDRQTIVIFSSTMASPKSPAARPIDQPVAKQRRCSVFGQSGHNRRKCPAVHTAAGPPVPAALVGGQNGVTKVGFPLFSS